MIMRGAQREKKNLIRWKLWSFERKAK